LNSCITRAVAKKLNYNNTRHDGQDDFEHAILCDRFQFGISDAAAHLEQLIGIIRRVCLDRMLVWSERHLRRVLKEFIDWSNRGCMNEGLSGRPDSDPVVAEPKPL
jgi:hypothetical protein